MTCQPDFFHFRRPMVTPVSVGLAQAFAGGCHGLWSFAPPPASLSLELSNNDSRVRETDPTFRVWLTIKRSTRKLQHFLSEVSRHLSPH